MLKVQSNFGVGKDQKSFFGNTCHSGLRHLFGGDGGFAEQVGNTAAGVPQHAGVNSLRAERGNPDALGVLLYGEPLCEGQRGVFGDGVRRRTDLRHQAGGRDSLQQIAGTAPGHARQHRARRVDVRLDVDGPDAVPVGIRCLFVAFEEDARVGAEQVDRPVFSFYGANQSADIGLARDIHREGAPANVCCDAGSAGMIDIGNGDELCVCRGEAASQRLPNPGSAAGNYDDLVRQFHSPQDTRKYESVAGQPVV